MSYYIENLLIIKCDNPEIMDKIKSMIFDLNKKGQRVLTCEKPIPIPKVISQDKVLDNPVKLDLMNGETDLGTDYAEILEEDCRLSISFYSYDIPPFKFAQELAKLFKHLYDNDTQLKYKDDSDFQVVYFSFNLSYEDERTYGGNMECSNATNYDLEIVQYNRSECSANELGKEYTTIMREIYKRRKLGY